MSVSRISVAILGCVFLTAACSDDTMDGGDQSFGADAGSTSFPDAAPSVADASPPTPPPDPGSDPSGLPVDLACTLDELQPIIQCVTDNCLDSFADNTTLTCVTFSCGLLLLGLPPECSQCLFSALSDPASALDACVLGLDDLGSGLPLPPAP
jgi:hypothetical protein